MKAFSCYQPAQADSTQIARSWCLSRSVLGGALGTLCTWALLRVLGLTINLSGSMPVGFYRHTQEPVQVGTIVAVCLPPEIAQFGLARGYLHAGPCAGGTQAVLKRIAAISGDVVEVQPKGLTIDGRPVAQSVVLAQDSHGRDLPHISWGTITLAPGEVWLLSTTDARSWDSRYYGPVPTSAVTATAQPVLVVP
jgi:conjugative transfer signal peptidase TraF